MSGTGVLAASHESPRIGMLLREEICLACPLRMSVLHAGKLLDDGTKNLIGSLPSEDALLRRCVRNLLSVDAHRMEMTSVVVRLESATMCFVERKRDSLGTEDGALSSWARE